MPVSFIHCRQADCDPAKILEKCAARFRYEVFDQTAYGGYHGVLCSDPGLDLTIWVPEIVNWSRSRRCIFLTCCWIPGWPPRRALVGAAGLAVCLRKIERQLGERTTVLMGTMSAFVFAAQMVNFPVGPGVSGHLLGGVLASVLLGPWAGAVVIAAVLLVQCFLFADGGVTALGANFVNMGLVGAVGGYAIYAPIRRMIGGQKGVLIAAMAAAWFSVILASGAFAIELGASGRWADFFHDPELDGAGARRDRGGRGADHRAGRALSSWSGGPTCLNARMIRLRTPRPAGRWGQTVLGGLGIALAVAVFLSPFAYDQPDGLEFVGEKLGFLQEDASAQLHPFPAPIPDYELKLPGMEHVKLATAAAGLVGTLVVFGVAWGMAQSLACAGRTKRPRPMRLEGLERHSAGTGPLHRLDARIKLVAALVFILIVIATPFGAWTALGSRGSCWPSSLAWRASRRANWAGAGWPFSCWSAF